MKKNKIKTWLRGANNLKLRYYLLIRIIKVNRFHSTYLESTVYYSDASKLSSETACAMFIHSYSYHPNVHNSSSVHSVEFAVILFRLEICTKRLLSRYIIVIFHSLFSFQSNFQHIYIRLIQSFKQFVSCSIPSCKIFFI